MGVLRTNTKFSFPSDNSVIRVDKHHVGQRRMGESRIIKDNFCFGLNEKIQTFKNKVQGEDGLRNRDAKSKADRICDFWLVFDNGVRLNVEMQDHLEPDMELIPRADMPKWLKNKIASENKQDVSQDEQSEDGEHAKKEVTVNEAIAGQGSI